MDPQGRMPPVSALLTRMVAVSEWLSRWVIVSARMDGSFAWMGCRRRWVCWGIQTIAGERRRLHRQHQQRSGFPVGKENIRFFSGLFQEEGMRFWSPTFRTRAESCISSLDENAMRCVCSKDTIEQSCQIKSRNLGCYVPCATAEVHSSNIQLKAQTSQHLMLPGNDMRLIMRVNR